MSYATCRLVLKSLREEKKRTAGAMDPREGYRGSGTVREQEKAVKNHVNTEDWEHI